MFTDWNENRRPMFLGYGTTNDMDGDRNRFIEDHLILPPELDRELRKRPEKDGLGFAAIEEAKRNAAEKGDE